MKSEDAFKLKMQFEGALNSIGYSLITEEFAYKLLAWLHHYGNHEAVVLDFSLSSDIRVAQKLLGLQGGEQLKPEVILKLKSYMEEGKDSPFTMEIFEKYNISKKL